MNTFYTLLLVALLLIRSLLLSTPSKSHGSEIQSDSEDGPKFDSETDSNDCYLFHSWMTLYNSGCPLDFSSHSVLYPLSSIPSLFQIKPGRETLSEI